MLTQKRLRWQPFPNVSGLSPELHTAMARDVEGLARRAQAAEGPTTFFGTMRAAAFHEAGHCVVFAHEGEPPTAAAIWPETPFSDGRVTWCGHTDAGAGWQVSDTTPVQCDLSRIRAVMAGFVCEVLAEREDMRAGSSLDEVVLSRALTMIAASKLGRSPRELFVEQAEAVRAILLEQWRIVTTIADELFRHRRVSKRRLARLLREVAS